MKKCDDAHQYNNEADEILFADFVTGLEDLHNAILDHSLRIPGFEDIIEIMENYIENGNLYSEEAFQNLKNDLQKGISSLLGKNKKMNPEFANDVIKRWAKHTLLRPQYLNQLENYIKNLEREITLKEEQKTQQEQQKRALDDLDKEREILQIINKITLLRMERLECMEMKQKYPVENEAEYQKHKKFENLDRIIQQSKLSTLPKP